MNLATHTHPSTICDCKDCGRPELLSKVRRCSSCGGLFCRECDRDPLAAEPVRPQCDECDDFRDSIEQHLFAVEQMKRRRAELDDECARLLRQIEDLQCDREDAEREIRDIDRHLEKLSKANPLFRADEPK